MSYCHYIVLKSVTAHLRLAQALLLDTGLRLRLHATAEGGLQSTRMGKATVAYPTIERLLFHMFDVMNLQKLLESHEMM